jgi:CheY-like chemotaxis protein
MSPAEASRLRVLLVEDDPDLADVTAEFLRAEGLDVEAARSGREALEVAPVFRPQLVLCDMNLPDMTGLDVVRGLRSNPSTEDTSFVILTAMRETERAHRREAETLGVEAFIPKPITTDAIRTLTETLATRPVRDHKML